VNSGKGIGLNKGIASDSRHGFYIKRVTPSKIKRVTLCIYQNKKGYPFAFIKIKRVTLY